MYNLYFRDEQSILPDHRQIVDCFKNEDMVMHIVLNFQYPYIR